MKRGIIALILWTLFLLGLLLAPVRETPIPNPGFMHWDKVAHFGLFAVTGFIGVFGFNFLGQFKFRMLFGTVFGLFLAISTEFAQSLVPLRDTSLYDLLADVVGLGVGLAFYALLYSRHRVRALLRL
jgi:VanZ family protein